MKTEDKVKLRSSKRNHVSPIITDCWLAHILDQDYYKPDILGINHILYILFVCFWNSPIYING